MPGSQRSAVGNSEKTDEVSKNIEEILVAIMIRILRPFTCAEVLRIYHCQFIPFLRIIGTVAVAENFLGDTHLQMMIVL
jgi:hypothetical protein